MADEKKTILTLEGLKEKEDRLVYLKKYLSEDIAEKLKEARSHGDLSENAEYDAAKNEQAEVAAEIEKLELMLKNVEIVSEDAISTKSVAIGAKVTVFDCELEDDFQVQIVGATEVNIFNKEKKIDTKSMKISNESPLGKALIGHEVGETVEVVCEDGVIRYRIEEISK